MTLSQKCIIHGKETMPCCFMAHYMSVAFFKEQNLKAFRTGHKKHSIFLEIKKPSAFFFALPMLLKMRGKTWKISWQRDKLLNR